MFEPQDIFIKTLSTVFLNPSDTDHTGKKVFIQTFLGCGCPDAVVSQATIRFSSRALGTRIEAELAQAPQSKAVTPFERTVNPLLGLPKTLKWPRSSEEKILLPRNWRPAAIDRVIKKEHQAQRLRYFRALCNTAVDAVIEVPGRAFFFIVAQGGTKLNKNTLRLQYESGQVLYQIRGYNRCRLFTITEEAGAKRIPQIDTALTWGGLAQAFDAARDRYPFAETILDYLRSIETGGRTWKNITNFPSVMC